VCDVLGLFIAIDQPVDLYNYRFRRVIGNHPCMYFVSCFASHSVLCFFVNTTSESTFLLWQANLLIYEVN
jgi:hypothetical protein